MLFLSLNFKLTNIVNILMGNYTLTLTDIISGGSLKLMKREILIIMGDQRKIRKQIKGVVHEITRTLRSQGKANSIIPLGKFKNNSTEIPEERLHKLE